MTVLVDNYDSFTFNLYQYLGEFDPVIRVVRNDEMSVDEIRSLCPDRIVLSPGPGRPENAGITMEAALRLGPDIPTLGVCLGEQAICEAYGTQVTYAKRLMHGKQSQVTLDLSCPVFSGLPEQIMVGRYHSLAADPGSMSDVLKVTALTDQGEIMAVMHRDFPIYGVQFHPESILTPKGKKIIENFVAL